MCGISRSAHRFLLSKSTKALFNLPALPVFDDPVSSAVTEWRSQCSNGCSGNLQKKRVGGKWVERSTSPAFQLSTQKWRGRSPPAFIALSFILVLSPPTNTHTHTHLA